MTNDQEEEKNDLNNENSDINRGFELLLRNRRRSQKPKTFQVKFDKMISLFKGEFCFYFEFYIDVKKKEDSLER
jgi:hypothetical protein